MSDYTQATDFSAKDDLASGDPEKVILGADLDAELAAIAVAIASKPDASNTPDLGGNTFTSTQSVSNATPRFSWIETDAAADEGQTAMDMQGGDIVLYARTDALAAGDELLRGVRGTGATYSEVQLMGQVIKAGTYTPTDSANSNLDSCTPALHFYIRVGDTVIVYGSAAVNVTTGGSNAAFEIDLPVASNIAATTDVNGHGAVTAAGIGATEGGLSVDGVVANDTARVVFLTSDTGASGVNYSFAYRVL